MAKYNFTISGNSLLMQRTPISEDTQYKAISFKSPSLVQDNNKIKLFEAGEFQTSLRFIDFGLIDGIAPTDLQDAKDKLLVLIGTISEGGGDFVPLSGTTAGNPITGDLEMPFDSFIGLVYKDENIRFGFGIGDFPIMFNTDFTINKTSYLKGQYDDFLIGSNRSTFKGLSGEQDFSANITELDYTQKKYVDPSTQRTTATSGTFTPTDTASNLIVIHEAGATTSLTINLPTTPRDKQQVTIMSVGGIVGLTIATAVGVIIGAVTNLSALGSVKFVWLASESKWYKI